MASKHFVYINFDILEPLYFDISACCNLKPYYMMTKEFDSHLNRSKAVKCTIDHNIQVCAYTNYGVVVFPAVPVRKQFLLSSVVHAAVVPTLKLPILIKFPSHNQTNLSKQ